MTDESERSTAGDDPVRVQYDWSSTAPSTAVIETVTEADDCDPTTIDPLYESFDPDALDTLMQPTSIASATPENVTVSFSFADQRVTVRGSGEVLVRPEPSE